MSDSSGGLGDLTYQDKHRHQTGPGTVTYHVEVEHGRRRPDAVVPEHGPVTPAYLHHPVDKTHVQVAVEPHGKTWDEMDLEAHHTAYEMAHATSPHDMVTNTRILHVEASSRSGVPGYEVEHEHSDTHPETMGGRLTAWPVGGEDEAAHLTYTEHPDHVRVHVRETHPAHRRRGLQTHLQDLLHQRFPGKPVRSYPEDFSGDAAAFRAKYMERRPGTPWAVESSCSKPRPLQVEVHPFTSHPDDPEQCTECNNPESNRHHQDVDGYQPRLPQSLSAYDRSWRPSARIFGPTQGQEDPRLFGADHKMLPEVRGVLVDKMTAFMVKHGTAADWTDWSRMYLAGSQASEWYGNNDFDILLGVDYDGFRRATNSHLSNEQITDDFNAAFRANWNDENWHPPFDSDETWHLTGYVNPESYDIRRIKPYAAYEILSNTWFVKPVEVPSDWGPDKFPESTWRIAEHYADEIDRISHLDPKSRQQYAQQLFDHIHTDRRRAFSDRGTGVFDVGNVAEKYLDQRPDHPLALLVEMKNAGKESVSKEAAIKLRCNDCGEDYFTDGERHGCTEKTAAGDSDASYAYRHIVHQPKFGDKRYGDQIEPPSQEQIYDEPSKGMSYGAHVFEHQYLHHGTPVAKLRYSIHPDEPSVINIKGLAVHPDHQRSGLAVKMVDRMQDHAAKNGMQIDHGNYTDQGHAFSRKYMASPNYNPSLHLPYPEKPSSTTGAEFLPHMLDEHEMSHGRTASMTGWEQYYANEEPGWEIDHDEALLNKDQTGCYHPSNGRVLAAFHKTASLDGVPVSEEEQEARLAPGTFKEQSKPQAEPSDHVVAGARGYCANKGLGDPHDIDYSQVHTSADNTRDIGRAYHQLPDHDPEAVPHFEAMRQEIHDQFHHMTHVMGIKAHFVDEDPYSNSKDMMHDVHHNKQIKVLRTAKTGGHPFFTDEENDKFRAVHDVFGHAATGRGFDKHGEEAAFTAHSKMFSDKARPAMETETRGQNHFYNLNGRFAKQKVALLHKAMGGATPNVFGRTARRLAVYL
jgi:GNAT superfamily N-acetyltransferase